jgi:hypothetical protein
MKIYYRISDAGYIKIKPSYINNENCLANFTNIFEQYIDYIHIIADNISETTYEMITKYIPTSNISMVNIGHGAGTFNLALNQSLSYDDDEIIYFVENDYLHKPGSLDILLEGFTIGFPYVTLYDHPDKYMDPIIGGNPLCTGRAENTRVYLSQSCHWKITNSTTMTFAAKVATLKKDLPVLKKWTSGTHPDDYQLFLELLSKNQFVISSIPGYATHGETKWLSPLTKWENHVYN